MPKNIRQAHLHNADEIKAVEVYWRSGEVEITESESPKLSVKESGGVWMCVLAPCIYRSGRIRALEETHE